MSFAQVNEALGNEELDGLCLLNVLAAFMTDTKPASRTSHVDTEALCHRIDRALRVAISEPKQLEDTADAFCLVCMAASGDELCRLLHAMAESGSLHNLLQRTCKPQIANITAVFERCV